MTTPMMLAILLHYARLTSLGWGGVLTYTYRVCLGKGMHGTSFTSILSISRPLTVGSMLPTMQLIFLCILVVNVAEVTPRYFFLHALPSAALD